MNDHVNAFTEMFRLATERTGPLSGLTFAVKDLIDVAGHPTGAGNPEWKRTHPVPSRHAPIVDMLLDAGAACIGKTHTDELAYSLMGANEHYGTPVNSAAPERMPGGSSSGSAAAVAAGLADFAVGSDTGGSVRLPASFCGIYGLRPTHGTMPMQAIVPLAPSFDVAGWFARDIEMMIRVAGVFGLAASPGKPASKIALLAPRDLWALPDEGVAEKLLGLRQKLERRFGTADETELAQGPIDAWRETFRVCQAAEVWAAHGAWVSRSKPDFGPGIKQRFEMASKITAQQAADAQAERNKIRAHVKRQLKGRVLLVPTTPGPAPMRNASDEDIERYRSGALSLLCVAGLCGLPQISIPAGSVGGAPVGFSLVGNRGDDGLILALSRSLTERD